MSAQRKVKPVRLWAIVDPAGVVTSFERTLRTAWQRTPPRPEWSVVRGTWTPDKPRTRK